MPLKKSGSYAWLKDYPGYGSKSRLYGIWSDMRKRCNTPGSTNYTKYGARGIRVCDEWNCSYKPFLQWALTNGYAPHLSIDREDNENGYHPENCRWATVTEQARNKRSVKFYEVGGLTGCITDWAKCLKINRCTLKERINSYGYTPEEAFLTRVGEKKWA